MSIVVASKKLNIKTNKMSLKKSTNFENITTNIFKSNQQKLDYINIVNWNEFASFKFFKNQLNFNNKLKICIADAWKLKNKYVKIA